MDSNQLTAGTKYVVQHGINKVLAKVDRIHHKINPDYSGIETDVSGLGVNDIAEVSFKLNKPIFYDQFRNHRTNGSFILIDPVNNNTQAVGMIIDKMLS